MNSESKFSFKVIRIIAFVSIIALLFLVVKVFADRNDVNYITINFADDTSISVVTSATKVSDILQENNIVLASDEIVEPSLDSDINATKVINISNVTDTPIAVASEKKEVTAEEILGSYSNITEKIITEQVEIPYETVTKDVSQSGTETTDKVIQEGQNGLKELKYRVKFQDEVEIDRVLISEIVIKEPVEKIIQISTKIVSRSSSYVSSSAVSLAARVEGVEPQVVTLNASAYSAAEWGGSAERTASGPYARSWYTVAAGPSVPFGTIVYIPYFASAPNGGWFVVEDRGGAITNSKIDIYMDTVSECYSFGRRNLECYIY